jgi:hypothetical protein
MRKALEEKEKAAGSWRGYDFVFLDGAHTWNIDAAAFFIAEKLMRSGAWILFDDLKYTYRNYFDATQREDRYGVLKSDMAQDEIYESHVGLIFELLARSHPNISRCGYSKSGHWGWAQKRSLSRERAAKTGLPVQSLPLRIVRRFHRFVEHKFK